MKFKDPVYELANTFAELDSGTLFKLEARGDTTVYLKLRPGAKIINSWAASVAEAENMNAVDEDGGLHAIDPDARVTEYLIDGLTEL